MNNELIVMAGFVIVAFVIIYKFIHYVDYDRIMVQRIIEATNPDHPKDFSPEMIRWANKHQVLHGFKDLSVIDSKYILNELKKRHNQG